jgi:hypothetical protein
MKPRQRGELTDSSGGRREMAYANAGMNANRVARMVSSPKWGGGLHREHLEYLMGVTPRNRKQFEIALMIAYRQGLVTFCRGYVCCPARNRESV